MCLSFFLSLVLSFFLSFFLSLVARFIQRPLFQNTYVLDVAKKQPRKRELHVAYLPRYKIVPRILAGKRCGTGRAQINTDLMGSTLPAELFGPFKNEASQLFCGNLKQYFTRLH